MQNHNLTLRMAIQHPTVRPSPVGRFLRYGPMHTLVIREGQLNIGEQMPVVGEIAYMNVGDDHLQLSLSCSFMRIAFFPEVWPRYKVLQQT